MPALSSNRLAREEEGEEEGRRKGLGVGLLGGVLMLSGLLCQAHVKEREREEDRG